MRNFFILLKKSEFMITLVAFLSRPHGYNTLCGIIDKSDYKLLKVYTHKLKPKSEDPNKAERKDYQLFVEKCKENKIPVYLDGFAQRFGLLDKSKKETEEEFKERQEAANKTIGGYYRKIIGKIFEKVLEADSL